MTAWIGVAFAGASCKVNEAAAIERPEVARLIHENGVQLSETE